MVINDTNTRQGMIQECESMTQIGKAGISGNTDLLQDFIRRINTRYHEVITLILKAQSDWDYDDINHTDFPILTTNLVANQQDYSLPASEKILKIKRVEVSYDGVTWNKAEPLDIGQRSEDSTQTTIDSEFTANKPFYDIQYNSIFLYPFPTQNVTGGLKLWIAREVDEFTTSDTTQEPGIDKPFHIMLPLGASIDWCNENQLFDRADRLQIKWSNLEKKLADYYGKKQEDRPLRFSGAEINYE